MQFNLFSGTVIKIPAFSSMEEHQSIFLLQPPVVSTKASDFPRHSLEQLWALLLCCSRAVPLFSLNSLLCTARLPKQHAECSLPGVQAAEQPCIYLWLVKETLTWYSFAAQFIERW